MFWPKRLGSIVLGIAACFLIQLIAVKGFDDYGQRLIVLAGIYVTLAVSLNLINGITGQFSIGHAAFYQVGAYTAAFLTGKYFASAHLPPLLWFIIMAFIGAIGAAIAGLVVGLPSLRLRGDYLAIVTLGFGEIIRIQVQNTPALGGAYGMNVGLGSQVASADSKPPIWLIWLLAVGCIAVCRNLIKTAHGLPFLAVREDEVASSAMGVNVTRVKVSAFVLGSAFAGAAGAFLAHYEGFINPATFAMDTSFIILTMVVLGGTGSITGSAVAAIFLSFLPEKLRGLKDAATGSALTVSSASVVAALLAVIVAVALMKRIESHGRGWEKMKRFYFYIGSIVAAVVAKLLFQLILDKTTKLGAAPIAVEQLRMVIFAVTLVVLMLLRPQGIFGHHEFSWTWLKKLTGKKKDEPTPAVAA